MTDSATIEPGERGLLITWDEQVTAEYLYIWLRDNDPDELHPQTRERVFDLTTVPLEIRPEAYAIEDGSLVVRWPNRPGASVYPLDWLRTHRPGRPRHDAAIVPPVLWDRETLARIPRTDAAQCGESPEGLLDALRSLKRHGLILVTGLGTDPAAAEDFGDLIGFRRETNFGRSFEVVSRTDPNNLAYTSLALPLHTDLPNQEAIPGYQFLHCIRNSTDGGDSVFADGYRICHDLRSDSPEDFDLLTRVRLPFRFHDERHDIRKRRAIISLHEDGSFNRIVFNAHIADVPDMEPGVLYRFYRAYQTLMIRIREAKYAVGHRLAPGEMAVFDNCRVLHSRTAFDPGSGERYFRGYYIERNEVDSRIRVLSRTEVT